MLIFNASKQTYCRHCKTWWNMFAFFCGKWFFRIIFASINLVYYTLKICISKVILYIIKYLLLIKFWYFSVIRRHYATKIFYFHILFYTIAVCFLLQQNGSNSDNKNHHDVYKLFLLIMLVVFLTAR